MGNRDNWSYIQIPKIVFEEIESILDSGEFKKKGIVKPKDITLILLRKFIDKGSELLKIIEKEPNPNMEKMENEIVKIKTIIDGFSRMSENFIQFIEDETKHLGKSNLMPIETNFEEIRGMKGIEATEKYIIIRDNEIKKDVKLEIKKKKLICSHDKSEYCKHTVYTMITPGFCLAIRKQGVESNLDMFLGIYKVLSKAKL